MGPVYLKINVDCSREWNEVTWCDTAYNSEISLKIMSRCKDKVTFIDTINSESDTFLIRSWRDIELVVNYPTVNSGIKIDKKTYWDKLADDLKFNGFLTPPHEIKFNPTDSSVTFKTFIGHADSDVGDIYVLRIGKDAKTEVIAVEASDIDDIID